MKPDDNNIRWDIVPFFHGKILDISEGKSRAFPHFISHLDAHVSEPWNLSVFSGQSMDGIVSSYLLHLLEPDEIAKALPEWSRVIKKSGHIVIHLPITNDKSKWKVSYDVVVDLMGKLSRGWDLVHFDERKDGSMLFAFKLS